MLKARGRISCYHGCDPGHAAHWQRVSRKKVQHFSQFHNSLVKPLGFCVCTIPDLRRIASSLEISIKTGSFLQDMMAGWNTEEARFSDTTTNLSQCRCHLSFPIYETRLLQKVVLKFWIVVFLKVLRFSCAGKGATAAEPQTKLWPFAFGTCTSADLSRSTGFLSLACGWCRCFKEFQRLLLNHSVNDPPQRAILNVQWHEVTAMTSVTCCLSHGCRHVISCTVKIEMKINRKPPERRKNFEDWKTIERFRDSVAAVYMVTSDRGLAIFGGAEAFTVHWQLEQLEQLDSGDGDFAGSTLDRLHVWHLIQAGVSESELSPIIDTKSRTQSSCESKCLTLTWDLYCIHQQTQRHFLLYQFCARCERDVETLRFSVEVERH